MMNVTKGYINILVMRKNIYILRKFIACMEIRSITLNRRHVYIEPIVLYYIFIFWTESHAVQKALYMMKNETKIMLNDFVIFADVQLSTVAIVFD